MKSIIFTAICTLFCCFANGQVGFFDGTSQVLGEEELHSTICIGFEDINGDLKDDLFLLDEGEKLKTFYQQAPGEPFEFTDHLQISSLGDWSFISGDLDNDGIPEIVCSGLEDGSQFLKFDGYRYNTEYNAGSGDIFAQNSNLADLNNDGFLDFFVCNDDGENLMFVNNGNGGMIQTKLIDFQTSPTDDMSGNYTSIFTDIDDDDDLDLYIGKCKGGVTDPTDPRRVNTLYINNGDGTYTEKAEEFGLNTGAQSWSVDAGDVDNDGDPDIIIANHDRAHDLMINNGNGHFDRMTLAPDGYKSFAFQSFFCDFDNNGWLDIFITDPSATFILFNDEMSFTRRDLLGSGRKAFSGATGDLNSDGFPDLYLGFANSFQSPSLMADKVLLNESNSNNYLDINLIGSESNRDAVGAKVILYQNEKMQTREILAGKSYGIMNSTVVHFGLGKTTEVDSIKIKWPSGIEIIIDDVSEINTLLSVTENGCITSTYIMPDLQLCGGDSIEVILPLEYYNFNWSNGSTEASTWINEPGLYNVEFEDNGCLIRSSYFEVTEEKDLKAKDILPKINIVACKGDVVKLESYPGILYDWSTGENTPIIDVVESGIYNVSMSTNCNDYISEDNEVLFVDHNSPIAENDTIKAGEMATLIGENDELNWYQNKNDPEPIFIGSEFVTPPLYENQTYFVGEATAGSIFSESLMTTVPLNNVGDSIYTENDFVQFEVIQDLTINSIRLRTQKSGFRRFVISEGSEELKVIYIGLIEGVNNVRIDYRFSPGIYKMETDPITNQSILGTDHPQLSYSTIYTKADKSINGYLKIADSEIYPGVTPYFFDWDIDYGHYDCEPRIPVHAIVKMPVSTSEVFTNSYVYPNPTSGKISVKTDMGIPFSIDVLDISGTKVMKTIDAIQSHMTFDMPKISGMYFLKLTNEFTIEVKKVYVY